LSGFGRIDNGCCYTATFVMSARSTEMSGQMGQMSRQMTGWSAENTKMSARSTEMRTQMEKMRRQIAFLLAENINMGA
jgi:hypothetical protein